MKEKKEKEKQEKPRRFSRNQVYVVLGALAVYLLFSFQTARVLSRFEDLEERQSSLIAEVGKLNEDSAEVRRKLGLEVIDLKPSMPEVDLDSDDNEQNEDQLQLALFQYVDFLGANRKLAAEFEAKEKLLEQMAADVEFGTFLNANKLAVGEFKEDDAGSYLSIKELEGADLFSLALLKEDNSLVLRDFSGDKELKFKEYQPLANFLRANALKVAQAVKNLRESEAKLVAEVSAVAADGEFLELMTRKGLVLNENRQFVNKSGATVGSLAVKMEGGKAFVALDDAVNPANSENVSTQLKAKIMKFTLGLEHLTFIERKVEEALASLEATFKDKGFVSVLADNGVRIGERREDEDRYYFDVFYGEEQISSIVLEKATGVVNITRPDGTNSENILLFDPEFKKKTLEIPENLPEFTDVNGDGQFNILVAGKHGSLVDTMIFVHIDEETKQMRMVSIPRDLFFNGRKINAYASLYGMPELKKALSKITGYQLDKYVLIDMYAFIDVVDLVGGIDITLEKAVVDPSYRVVDNGVEGTLNYQPGDYHLGGKEALRLARSRKTSSDFARAERQQLILRALQDKARNLGFGDTETLYEIARTVLAKTETDVSLDEAVAYYFKYQDYEIASMNVMSSANVLYVPPYVTAEQCNARIAEAEANGAPRPGCENENQAYTLAPRNNDWNVIKWFFRQEFGE